MFKPALISSQWSLAALALCLAALPASAQFPYQWTVETTKAESVSFDAYQGETIPLEPAYKLYGTYAPLTNIVTATFYWQSSDMADSWWSKPAEVLTYGSEGTPDRIRATFAPTNDNGAAYYTFFIKATSSAGSSYRANGTLIMRRSPGFIPATLPSPDVYPTLAAQIAPYVISALPPYDPLGSALAVSGTLTDAWAEYYASIEAEFNNISNYTATVSELAQTNAAALRHFDGLWWSSPSNYTDAAGIQWEIGEVEVTDDTQLRMYSSRYPQYGVQTLSKTTSDIWRAIVPDTDIWYMAGNLLGLAHDAGDFYVWVGNHEVETVHEWQPYVSDFESWPKVWSALGDLYNSSTGWVDVTRSMQIVTNTLSAVASTNYVADAISAHTVNFQDCLLYASSGTNYYFRWNAELNTYTVTGVPQ